MIGRLTCVLALGLTTAVVGCSGAGDSDPEGEGESSQAVTTDGGATVPAPTTTTDAGADAAPATFRAEGRKVIAGAAINPPNPVFACDQAKQAARERAAAAGFGGRVVWDRLSRDSDCSLSTTYVPRVGAYYTFTARGTFYR